MSGKIVAAFGLAIVALGVWILASPAGVIEFTKGIITPRGLGVGAAFRVGLGILLWVAAGASRTPRTFKVFGALFVLGGVAILLLGVEGITGIWEWTVSQGDGFIRFDGLMTIAVGAFFMWSTMSRRPANPLPGDA